MLTNYNSDFSFLTISDSSQSLTESKMQSFGALELNWSAMGEGERISSSTIASSMEIYYWLRNRGFESFETQPGLAGEIWLSAIRGSYELEVVTNNDLKFELYITISDSEVEDISELNLKELYSKIKELDLPWNSSESSTPNIMMLEATNNDSPEWPLDHFMAEYQSFQNAAPLLPARQSVDTLKLTIAA